jgi:F-type H+-transporting ATPase subunit gamma
MKVLAAISIHQYEQAVESLTDYSRTVDLGMQVIVSQNHIPPLQPYQVDELQSGIVVFGSDHGLCGGFNEAISNFTIEKLKQFGQSGERYRLLTIGARTHTTLEAKSLNVETCLLVPSSVSGIGNCVRQIIEKLDVWQSEGVRRVLLFYNRHRPGTNHEPTMQNLLPVDSAQYSIFKSRPWPSRSIPSHTMADDKLLSSLVRQYLFISIFRASAESLASEHTSRLISMQIAEKNIKECIDELDTKFRQQRQNAITEELLDVVSGFEMLHRQDQ